MPAGCAAGDLLRTVGGTISASDYYCKSQCPNTVSPNDFSVTLTPGSAGQCRVTRDGTCGSLGSYTCSRDSSTPCCSVRYTCTLSEPGSTTWIPSAPSVAGPQMFKVCVQVIAWRVGRQRSREGPHLLPGPAANGCWLGAEDSSGIDRGWPRGAGGRGRHSAVVSSNRPAALPHGERPPSMGTIGP